MYVIRPSSRMRVNGSSHMNGASIPVSCHLRKERRWRNPLRTRSLHVWTVSSYDRIDNRPLAICGDHQFTQIRSCYRAVEDVPLAPYHSFSGEVGVRTSSPHAASPLHPVTNFVHSFADQRSGASRPNDQIFDSSAVGENFVKNCQQSIKNSAKQQEVTIA
jgi:hypothetical protein